MSLNEQETRYHLIDPVLRGKGYDDHQWIRLETPAPVDPIGPKGRRRRGPGRTDYLLCVRVGDIPKPLPLAVLEAKKETDDPLKGMQQATALTRRKQQLVRISYKFKPKGTGRWPAGGRQVAETLPANKELLIRLII